MSEAPHIRWFEDCDATSTAEVGGKCAGLGELVRVGIAVPPGFAVTTAAHEQFLEQHDLARREGEVLSAIDYTSLPDIEEASERLRALVDGSEVVAETADAIRKAYDRLGESVPVAVRSSAVSEDLEGASFAGQLETYLWVEGGDAVVEHIRRCWAGFFTPTALMYRHEHRVAPSDLRMSVGVQRMVHARSAGVMFTLNPINGDRSKIVIESTWGLGEPLVSGEVDPDRFTVDKVTFGVLKREIGRKLIEHRPDPSRRMVVVDDVSEERRGALSLSDAEVLALARLGKSIERHYGSPQDVEWAIDDASGEILALQARPETVWNRRERAPTVKKKGSALEYVVADLLGR